MFYGVAETIFEQSNFGEAIDKLKRALKCALKLGKVKYKDEALFDAYHLLAMVLNLRSIFVVILHRLVFQSYFNIQQFRYALHYMIKMFEAKWSFTSRRVVKLEEVEQRNECIDGMTKSDLIQF